MNNPMNFIQMLNQLKSNPLAILSQRYNIPQTMNNPNDIIQHLMNTGQVSQSQYNAASQAAKQYFGNKH
ncbi:hypothetical protein [Ruminococcus sp.]|uniref:hypothetical protein n=1 Tax=Ruminococcus sp. TaxID=41978 RepID=UPI00388FAA53